MEYKYSLLSAKEKEEILNCFFSEDNMKMDFSLTPEELQIVKKFKNPSVSLGYALQLLFLKNRGISIISLYTFIPDNIILYVADQIDCNSIYSKLWSFPYLFQILCIMKWGSYSQKINNSIIRIMILRFSAPIQHLKTHPKILKITKTVNFFLQFPRKSRKCLSYK